MLHTNPPSLLSCAKDTTIVPKEHRDAKVSLQPLSFDEAMKALSAVPPKHKGSEAEESGSTKSDAPESAPSKRRSAPRRKPSGG